MTGTRSTGRPAPGRGLPAFVARWALWNLPVRLWAAILTLSLIHI